MVNIAGLYQNLLPFNPHIQGIQKIQNHCYHTTTQLRNKKYFFSLTFALKPTSKKNPLHASFANVLGDPDVTANLYCNFA